MHNFIKNSKADVVLIILEPHPKSNLPLLNHCTFACESYSTLTYLRQQICRKKLKLNSNFSLFLYTGKKVLIGIYLFYLQGIKLQPKLELTMLTRMGSYILLMQKWMFIDNVMNLKILNRKYDLYIIFITSLLSSESHL